MNRTKSIEKFAQSSHIYTKAAMFIHDPAIVRILIVEDDPIMQLGLTQALEDYPIFSIVRQARGDHAGVEMALALKPDVIVMDIGLPCLDRIVATQQIRAKLPNLQVVMLTSHTAETEIIASLSSGADAY